MIRALVAYIRIVAPAHDRAGLCLTLENGDLCSHRLSRCELIFSAVGHKNSACADGGVKAFYQTLLRAYVQVGHKGVPAVGAVGVGLGLNGNGNGYLNGGVLFGTVGVQEFS